MKRLLSIGLLALAACSSPPTAPVVPNSSPRPAVAPSRTASVGPIPAPSFAAGSPIIKIEVAGSLTAEGQAQAPGDTFDHSLDRKLIAVLTLSGVGPGTKLSYVRYLDGRFVDSKSALTTGTPRRFYFEFAASAGQELSIGLYRLRLYVAERAVGEVSYRVR